MRPVWQRAAEANFAAHQAELSKQRRVRRCLQCGEQFTSQHFGNRMCAKCHGTDPSAGHLCAARVVAGWS